MSRFRISAVLIVATLLVAPAAYLFLHWRSQYPYGHSHCCILSVATALESYAGSHSARYPSGEATPEASLGLLHDDSGLGADLLRGMTVPEFRTRDVLNQGRPLTPETCGWHYVEGLTMADDRQLALLWCKEALGHNGQRAPDGGRQVVYVGGMVDWVSGAEWTAFLEEQKALRSKRSERARNGLPLVAAAVELPDGSRVENIAQSYNLVSSSKGPDSSGSGSSSGSSFHASSLTWFHPPIQNGAVTRTLSFAGMKTAPVTVTFIDGEPDLEQIVFKLQASGQSGE